MRLTHFQRGCLGPLIALMLTAFLSGCGGGPYPVDGLVVWKDGSPAKELAGAQVVFDLPERQISARGTIQADGTFRLTTDNKDGALPGEYKVLILEVGRASVGTALAPGFMDSKYSDPASSDLQATVNPGNNVIKLTVERNPRR